MQRATNHPTRLLRSEKSGFARQSASELEGRGRNATPAPVVLPALDTAVRRWAKENATREARRSLDLPPSAFSQARPSTVTPSVEPLPCGSVCLTVLAVLQMWEGI